MYIDLTGIYWGIMIAGVFAIILDLNQRFYEWKEREREKKIKAEKVVNSLLPEA